VPEGSRARVAAALALLLLGFAALALPSLGAAPLERAEIYFLDAARAMAESGDWTVPRYQGEPFFDKPPLTYWLMGAAFLGLAPEPGAARLVPALAALATLLATAWLGVLLFDRRTAVAGAVVLSTTVAFLTFARVAMSDMLLTMLTTLAVALGVRAYRPDPPAWTVPALGAVLGLGFATKGPIAVLVPGIALLLLLVQTRRLPFGFRAAVLAAGAFVVLGFGWFALVYARLGAGPLEYFFLRENIERFAGEAFDVGRPAWFYLPAYAAEGLPWSPFLPLAVWRLLGAGGGDEDGRRSARFLVGWVGLVLVPLGLSSGKLDYYLLPLYPAVSLLIGRLFVGVPWRRLERTWGRAVLLLLVAALAVATLRPPRVPGDWLPGPGALALLAGVLATSGLAAVVVAARPNPRRVMAVLAGAVAAAWLVLTVFFLPAFARAQPNRAIARDVAREHRYRPNLRFATCSDPARARRDVLFHARVTAEERCDLWPLAASRAPYLLLVRPEEDRSFRSVPGYRHVATYRYLPGRSLTLAGFLSPSEPGETVLIANFATTDRVAERKRRRESRKALHEAIEKSGYSVVRPRRKRDDADRAHRQ
jgi:4-amino-4-deoxy-L-arabinose transferase-like glycosyltransferase